MEHAISVGLDVPKTRIASSRSELLEFHNSNKTEGNEVITKVLNVAINIPFDGGSLLSYTSVLDMENLNNFPELIFPTLLQEKLKKQFELRVFYLNEKTYTMAILSQNDPQTSVDFRNYNYEKPNRNPPFQLPQEIEDKIIKFMQILKLNCGSLDFVYTVDNKYVFLEVNPIGQFGMTSYPTNYYLEKLIAETL